MANIRTGAFIGAIRGKVGTEVYSKNQYGPYVRGIAVITDPDTEFQAAWRAGMAACYDAWLEMSESDRLEWERYAETGPWVGIDKLRDEHQLSGYSLFVKLNMKVMTDVFEPSILLPPGKVQLSAVQLVSAELDDEDFILTFSTDTLQENEVIRVYCTDSYRPSIMKPKRNQFKIIAYIPAGSFDAEVSILDAFFARFGSFVPDWKVAVRTELINLETAQSYFSGFEKLIIPETPPAGGLVDADGNEYTTVLIGDLEVSVENWRCTKLDDGTPISEVTDGGAWNALTTPGRCSYNNDSGNATTYGFIYNRAALAGIAPAGWRVPSLADWDAIRTTLGGGSVAGGKMKQTGTTTWNSPNSSADNSSGFTGLGGGFRLGTGSFDFLNQFTGFHTGDIAAPPSYFVPLLAYNAADLYNSENNEKDGYYIRLCRDV